MSAVYTDLAVNLPILPDVFQHCRQPTAFHCAAEPTGDESSTAVNVDALPMALHELEGRDIQATVPEEDQDMEFQKNIVSLCVRRLKFFRRERRDGYKSVAHTEIDLTSGMVVDSAAGPRWVSFGRNVRDRQITIEDDLLWKLVSSRDASDCCAEDEGLNHLKEATQSASPPVESAGVIPPGFQHKCSRRYPLPPPRPPPSTSWCWKRLLESVTDPQQYIRTATPATLEALDSECHETICHAIARAFGTDPAVTLIHLLINNVSPLLFGVQDKYGNTPLHNAATAGNAAIARELVVLRPSAVCVRNHDCLTPLDIALDHRNDEMVECLLRELVQYAPDNSSVIRLLEYCLMKSLENGYTHFLQLILQLRTEHGLAIDFECTNSCGHTAWHQAAPAVRAVVAELLQESDLRQPLLGRLLNSLSFDACPHSPLEISRDPAAIDHRDTTLPSTSDSEESDADSTASIPESSEEDQGNVDSTTAATPLVEQEAPPNDGVDPPTEGAVDEEQNRASIATETDVGHAQVEREESIEHAPDSISNPEGAASLSISQDALETPSELVEQKNRVTATTSTTLGECDTQAHSGHTVSQSIEQALPPNDDTHSQAISLSSTHSRPTSLSNSESTHSNSESTTDSSVHLPSTDTAHTEAILVLSDYTSAEDHRPLRYSQPYTDSVTSSPNDSSSPQKPSVPKSRRKQRRTAEERVSLSRPFSTSGSDNMESSKRQSQRSRDSKKARVKRSSYSRFSRYRLPTTSSLREPSRRRPHRSRDSVKARAKSGSFSEYEVSPPLSNDEHSTADSAVDDSLPCESTVDEWPTLLPAPSSPSHRLALLKSRKQRSEKKSSQKTKLVTLSTFFRASGEFNKKVFKTWITRTVSRSSYKHLRFIVHQQLFTVFGFSPLRVSLTAKERRMALAVLEFVKYTKHSIPQEFESNLKTMEKVVKSTRHVNETDDETKSGDGLAKKNEADTHEKQQHYTEESEVDKSTKPSPAEPKMCCTPQNSEKDDSTQLSPSQHQMDSTQTSADEVEPPLPATKPLAVGGPSLELALAEIRRQLKEEQDSAVAKLREEYASLVAEREMKLIAEMEKQKEEQEYRETKLREELKEQLKGELREGMREEYENLVTAEVVKLKEANPVLVAELQELKRHTGFEHSQLLTNSESASDISQSSDETTDTTSVEDQRTRRPQQYSHPYTGSITSSAPSDSSLPQKPPVPASRKRQRHKAEQRISLNRPSTPSSSDIRKHSKSNSVKKNKHSMSEVRRRQRCNTQDRLSLYRPSTSSSSDTREPSKRRPRRSRESVKKKKHSSSESGRTQKQRFSLYRPSTSYCSDTTEHSKKRQCRHRESSSDSVKTETNSECETSLFDNHSPESTVKEPPTNPLTSPLYILKSGAGRRQTLRSKYKNRTKMVTLAKFFTATGRFNKEGFKTWLTAIVGRSSYNHLRTVVHHKPFAVFGFSSPKLRKLSRRERVIGRAVISLVSSKKFPVPPSVKDNLQSLKAVLDAQKKSSVSLPSKSEALKPLLHGPRKENDQEESSVDSDSSANDTLTDTQPWTRPTPEECVGASLLHFANTSHLIHCPVKVCHPPQNTCPPYDTFGGNYYTIADQHSNPASHSQTDHTEELSAARSRDHEDSESHCVVPDITTPGEVELGTTSFEVEVGTTPFEVELEPNEGARHSESDRVVPDITTPCEVELGHSEGPILHLVPSLVMQQLNKTTESHSSHCPRPKQSSELHPPTSSHTHQENIISETTYGPGHQGHNALVTAVGVESDTSLDLFSTSHSHHHETAQYTGSEASSSTLASKHQQKRDKETAKKGRKVAEDRRQFSSSESDTKPRPKRLKRLKNVENQEKSSKQSSSTTDSSHDEPLPSKICASGNPPSFCEQHNVKKDVEVSSSDSSGPCTVRPQPDNSCCSPFLAGLPKPTAVPQDTPNCSTAIALVRLHYKYCTNEIQIFNPHMAANLGEVIEELTGLFEHKLCNGGFTKMVIITDTENYHTDLDNIIQTCLLKKYYLQLVPRHQLKFGDPEQPHRISLSECSGERACVVGNPTLPPFVINGNRLRNLPGAAAEVAFLTHLFQCHPLTLKEASKEAVTNKLERARFAHLATHDYNKGLVLSDAVLTSSDIEQLLFERGPPVLVVLNCCGTADTVCERKGLESIALALLKVNVLAVVAVFGSVEDKLALRFAKLFYHYMIEVGLPATHALYNAQHEVYPPDFTHQYIYLGKDLKFIK